MAVYVALLVLFAVNFWINRNKGLSYPANYLFLFPFVYFVLKYFVYLLFDIPPLDDLALDALTKSGVVILIFFLSAFAIFAPLQLLGTFAIKPFRVEPRFPLSVVSYGLIGVLMLLIVANHGLEGLVRPYTNRLLLDTQGVAYFFIAVQFVSLCYSLDLLYRRQYSQLALFAVVYAVISYVTARAGLQVMFFINLILFSAIVFRRRVGKYFAYVAIFAIPYVILTGIQRTISFTSTNLSWSETLAVVEATFSQGLFYDLALRFFHRVDQLESLTLLADALERGSISYSYGSHMFGLLYQWVPRAMWPEKPLNFTSEMTLLFRPDVYYIASARNNFTGIGEILYNFGLVGVFLAGAIYGAMVAASCSVWERARGSYSMALLLLGYIYPYCVSGLLAGFLNDFAAPILLVTFLLTFAFFRVHPPTSEGRLQ